MPLWKPCPLLPLEDRSPQNALLCSSLEDRNVAERAFFLSNPWSVLVGSGRIGIENLRSRLSGLNEEITRNEFPAIQSQILKRLEDR